MIAQRPLVLALLLGALRHSHAPLGTAMTAGLRNGIADHPFPVAALQDCIDLFLRKQGIHSLAFDCCGFAQGSIDSRTRSA
jgi:hypothetical protein